MVSQTTILQQQQARQRELERRTQLQRQKDAEKVSELIRVPEQQVVDQKSREEYTKAQNYLQLLNNYRRYGDRALRNVSPGVKKDILELSRARGKGSNELYNEFRRKFPNAARSYDLNALVQTGTVREFGGGGVFTQEIGGVKYKGSEKYLQKKEKELASLYSGLTVREFDKGAEIRKIDYGKGTIQTYKVPYTDISGRTQYTEVGPQETITKTTEKPAFISSITKQTQYRVAPITTRTLTPQQLIPELRKKAVPRDRVIPLEQARKEQRGRLPPAIFYAKEFITKPEKRVDLIDSGFQETKKELMTTGEGIMNVFSKASLTEISEESERKAIKAGKFKKTAETPGILTGRGTSVGIYSPYTDKEVESLFPLAGQEEVIRREVDREVSISEFNIKADLEEYTRVSQGKIDSGESTVAKEEAARKKYLEQRIDEETKRIESRIEPITKEVKDRNTLRLFGRKVINKRLAAQVTGDLITGVAFGAGVSGLTKLGTVGKIASTSVNTILGGAAAVTTTAEANRVLTTGDYSGVGEFVARGVAFGVGAGIGSRIVTHNDRVNAKVERIRNTKPKVEPVKGEVVVSFTDAVKKGTTPDGLDIYNVKGTAETTIIDANTGNKIGSVKTSVNAEIKAGSAGEAIVKAEAESIRNGGVRVYKSGKKTTKSYLSEFEGGGYYKRIEQDLYLGELEGVVKDTGVGRLKKTYGAKELEILINKDYTFDVNFNKVFEIETKKTTKSRVQPKDRVLANILSKKIGETPVTFELPLYDKGKPAGIIEIPGKQIISGSKGLFSITPETLKVKGYKRKPYGGLKIEGLQYDLRLKKTGVNIWDIDPKIKKIQDVYVPGYERAYPKTVKGGKARFEKFDLGYERNLGRTFTFDLTRQTGGQKLKGFEQKKPSAKPSKPESIQIQDITQQTISKGQAASATGEAVINILGEKGARSAISDIKTRQEKKIKKAEAKAQQKYESTLRELNKGDVKLGVLSGFELSGVGAKIGPKEEQEGKSIYGILSGFKTNESFRDATGLKDDTSTAQKTGQTTAQALDTQLSLPLLTGFTPRIKPPIIKPRPDKFTETTGSRKRRDEDKLFKKPSRNVPYDVFVAGRKVADNLPINQAKSVGSFITDNTTAAQFRIQKSRGRIKKIPQNIPQDYWFYNQNKFREYRKVRGQKVKQPNIFIEMKNRRIDTPGEYRGVTAAKFIKGTKSNIPDVTKGITNLFGKI